MPENVGVAAAGSGMEIRRIGSVGVAAAGGVATAGRDRYNARVELRDACLIFEDV